MLATPDVHYARSGDVNVAYQVFGSGPLDIVMIPGWISHLEATWEVAEYRAWLERLGSFARVITFDKRGTGMSDRASVETTLETRIDDLRAVMDAVGSERAAVIAWFEAAPMAILFAATHPDRVRSLVLGDPFAKWTADADHPWGPDAAILDAVADSIAAGEWGRASAARALCAGCGGRRALRDVVGALRTTFGAIRVMLTLTDVLLDFFKLDADRLAIVIGDVCGKGIPASIFMAVVVTVLRTAAREEPDAASTIARANAILCRDNAASLFATTFYAVLNLRNGTLEYCNCGHNAPVHIPASGGPRRLAPTGLPLALFADRPAAASCIQLNPGDDLILFTDGVTEALNPSKEEFGERLLVETLLGSRIFQQLNSFLGCLPPLTVSLKERRKPTILRASPSGGEI